MKIEKQYEAFVIGTILYAEQASQSIVRAIPYQLDELRAFYSTRPAPRELAEKIWEYAGRHKNARRGLAERLLGRHKEIIADLYMLSRLLYDFSYLLDGSMLALPDAKSLWYCLSLIHMRLSNRIANFPRKLQGHLNYFNYNDHLPKPIEIEDIVGASWPTMTSLR
jgi:hypothetical protein